MISLKIDYLERETIVCTGTFRIFWRPQDWRTIKISGRMFFIYKRALLVDFQIFLIFFMNWQPQKSAVSLLFIVFVSFCHCYFKSLYGFLGICVCNTLVVTFLILPYYILHRFSFYHSVCTSADTPFAFSRKFYLSKFYVFF